MHDNLVQAEKLSIATRELRRQWLKMSTAAVLAGAIGRTTTAGQASSGTQLTNQKLPYIDAHSHVWSPDVARWRRRYVLRGSSRSMRGEPALGNGQARKTSGRST